MPSLLLLVSILWACSAPAPAVFRNYFDAQLVATFSIEAAFLLIDPNSGLYLAIYGLGTIAVLALSGPIVREASRNAPLWLLAFPCGSFGLLFGWIAYRQIPTLTVACIVILLEGMALSALGLILGFMAPFGKRPVEEATLAILWLLLGVFDFGFVLFPKSLHWQQANDWFPQWACIAAFSWLGLRFRRQHL